MTTCLHRACRIAAFVTAIALSGFLAAPAAAQVAPPASPFGGATHLIVPIAQSWEIPPMFPNPPRPLPHLVPHPSPLPPAPPPPRPSGPPSQRAASSVAVEQLRLDTVIHDAAASTTIDLVLRNLGASRAEAVLLLPLPFDATVTSMELEGLGSEGVARILPRDEARRIYDGIVNQIRDPALVEFAGWNLVRSSVFPIEPGRTQRVRLSFDHLLEADGDRIDLVLPRSETMRAESAWSITIDASSDRPIVEAYSPTHPIEVKRLDERRLAITAATTRPIAGPFRLSLLRAPIAGDSPLAASVLLSPDPAGGGGQFMILGGLRAPGAGADADARREPRELILVIDRSGSMAGEKMKQAREAGLALIDKLRDGDFVNVVDFSTTVGSLYDAPRAVTPEVRAQVRHALERLAPAGGTNIHDALVEALGQAPTPAALRTVLFLTDGLPTVGRTVEADVRAAVEKGNVHGRRVHALGVGVDVNAPLLDRLGDLTRGSTTYVVPGDSIVAAAGRVGRVLDGPALLAPSLSSVGPSSVSDVVPPSLPDLHAGEQLVILGRYHSAAPFTVKLDGVLAGAATSTGRPERLSLEVVVDPSKATVRHAFVGRLWATRQIALLADEVRQLTAPGGAISAGDPRLRELTEQIVALSLRWGVLTEYTSFLATDGGAVSAPIAWNAAVEHCATSLNALATAARSGAAGVAQGENYNARKLQQVQNLDNRFKDSSLNDVHAVDQVCQVANRGFFRRGDAWIDGTLVAGRQVETALVPVRTIEFGSDEHRALIERLGLAGGQAVLGLRGDLYLDVDGEVVLLRNGC